MKKNSVLGFRTAIWYNRMFISLCQYFELKFWLWRLYTTLFDPLLDLCLWLIYHVWSKNWLEKWLHSTYQHYMQYCNKPCLSKNKSIWLNNNNAKSTNTQRHTLESGLSLKTCPVYHPRYPYSMCLGMSVCVCVGVCASV